MSEATGLYGECVVKTLISDRLGKGYNLYLDFLCHMIQLHPFTERYKRAWSSEQIQKRNLENLTKNDKNKIIYLQKDEMNVFRFKDKKKDETMLQTFHSKNTMNVGQTEGYRKKQRKSNMCLTITRKWGGGIIDIEDSVIIHYPANRKTIKWYHKLFFVFMDMTVLNASILYIKTSGKKLSLLEFRSQLVIFQLMKILAKDQVMH